MTSVTEEDYPFEGLMPKRETGVSSFLTKYPEYDGRGTIIAIFDSGVDPGAPGMQKTTEGKTKILERFDCSGCGDVDTSMIVQAKEGHIIGLSGKKLKIPDTWKNPTNNYRVGIKRIFDLYPERLRERYQEENKEKNWENEHKIHLAKANRTLSKFDSTATLSESKKLFKEDCENTVEMLTNFDKKYTDYGPILDCVLFHDGAKWVACVDTTEKGDLGKCELLGEYSVTHEYATLTDTDMLNYSINVHDGGNVLELVGLCSSHGTHVASIASAYFPDQPKLNGVAPGAQIVSLTIGDGRLGSMETGTALVRAMIKVMELQKTYPIHVINMSYGEHAHWSNAGRIGELMNEVVNKYGVVWVASAGNHGPALSTVGTPPDISQETVIGVGAYVSPEMMIAEYSMMQKLPGMPYTWSSRGPTIDGGCGVTVCAPGGAITSVPNFTLRNCQLFNGTSMASPHVAGAVAVLISGLIQKNVPYSPYCVKRALENSATKLDDVEPFAQGHGLLNVEKAFELLQMFKNAQERDVRFHITCSGVGAKGIYIRNKLNTKIHTCAVNVEPNFKHTTNTVENVSSKLTFNMRLSFVCDASYITYPPHLDLSNGPRGFIVKVDTSGLAPGVHRTMIEAYDVTCVQKGPIFHIPVTIIQPVDIPKPKYTLEYKKLFKPNTIHRQFFTVPDLATWAVLRLRTCETEAMGSFVIHCMQILPKQSCKSLEINRQCVVTCTSDCVHSFPVRGGIMLEVVVAKYWASLGEVNVDYSISFHGIKPSQPSIVMQAADGIHMLDVTTMQGEEVLPTITLKNSVQILRPSDSKIAPLTDRDIIPPSRQIYELCLTYPFHITKATEVSPNSPLLSDVLYESEFESQLWMLYDNNKQYLGSGDAYPSKYTIKLSKGDYVIKMHIRHDKKEYLEKLSETPLLLNQKLSANIILDVYGSHTQAVIGGKKAVSGHTMQSSTIPLYIAPLASDKYVAKSNNPAQYLTGIITYAKDELGKKADTYPFKYILFETGKRSSNDKNVDKDKSKQDEYHDAERDLKILWLSKFETSSATDEFYLDLCKEYPDSLEVHSSYLQCIDPFEPKKQLPFVYKPQSHMVSKSSVRKYIEVCNKILSSVDQEKILAHFAIKIDQRPDAGQIRQQMERQKNILIEALCRKGMYLCLFSDLKDSMQSDGDDVSPEEIVDVWQNLQKFVDPTDSKITNMYVLYFGLWHACYHKHYGRMIKYLTRIQEEKSLEEIEEKIIEVCHVLEWNHVVLYLERGILSKFPLAYKPF
ncbi:tripeptidyl-peptidase 2 isoform X2 [Onthophagus taurus]|uniref:tripeptidyl-peptidase 2 isoform X2 n=1 Tax=Onthophagus taurus TaxID=166361 RepID=UPI000C20B31F|nr:tripeptidyl-peptidase 2 isoform X2 [Onthophagus taurus]